jgi:hypothetical protein
VAGDEQAEAVLARNTRTVMCVDAKHPTYWFRRVGRGSRQRAWTRFIAGQWWPTTVSWRADLSVRGKRFGHTQCLPVGVWVLSGKLEFGTDGAEVVAAESPG